MKSGGRRIRPFPRSDLDRLLGELPAPAGLLAGLILTTGMSPGVACAIPVSAYEGAAVRVKGLSFQIVAELRDGIAGLAAGKMPEDSLFGINFRTFQNWLSTRLGTTGINLRAGYVVSELERGVEAFTLARRIGMSRTNMYRKYSPLVKTGEALPEGPAPVMAGRGRGPGKVVDIRRAMKQCDDEEREGGRVMGTEGEIQSKHDSPVFGEKFELLMRANAKYIARSALDLGEAKFPDDDLKATRFALAIVSERYSRQQVDAALQDELRRLREQSGENFLANSP